MVIDPIILEQLTAAVARCGIPRAEVEIDYQDYLQSEEIRVLSKSLSDDQIECLRIVEFSMPHPIVSFDSQQTFARKMELDRIHYQKKARDWLADRGRLDDLPIFEPKGETPLQFARRIETFCGFKPGSVFEENEQLGIITPKMNFFGQSLDRGWLWRKLFAKRDNERFECLINAMSASKAEEHGVRFGFVGNEYVIEDDQER